MICHQAQISEGMSCSTLGFREADAYHLESTSLLVCVHTRSGVAVNENNAVGLDGGAAFERWIKTGSWAEDGTDPQLRAMAIATAVVRACASTYSAFISL
jgi:hypothetical protein